MTDLLKDFDCYSVDEETFYDDISVIYDECDTHGEIIFFAGVTKTIKPSDLCSKWIVANILEVMEESLYDEVGEHAEGNLSMSTDNELQLEHIIEEFLDANVNVSCCGVKNVTEFKGRLVDGGLVAEKQYD